MEGAVFAGVSIDSSAFAELIGKYPSHACRECAATEVRTHEVT
jgi:hypothetical protein